MYESEEDADLIFKSFDIHEMSCVDAERNRRRFYRLTSSPPMNGQGFPFKPLRAKTGFVDATVGSSATSPVHGLAAWFLSRQTG